jgi:hypothetical protein
MGSILSYCPAGSGIRPYRMGSATAWLWLGPTGGVAARLSGIGTSLAPIVSLTAGRGVQFGVRRVPTHL